MGSLSLSLSNQSLSLSRPQPTSLSSVVTLLMPFSSADAESVGIFGAHEAVSGAKDPSRSDQSASADVLSVVIIRRSISKGDLPGELSVSGGESIDDSASGSLLAASLEGSGACHHRSQHDQQLHLLFCSRNRRNNLLRKKKSRVFPH